MILFIDTSDYNSVQIALISDRIATHNFESRTLSEQLLPEIKKILNRERVELKQLKKIAVVAGPGGFSRIRSSVSVANALAFGLKIPVVSVTKDKVPKNLIDLLSFPAQKMVEPFYDREPNITLPKK